MKRQETKAACLTPWHRKLFTKSTGNHILAEHERRIKGNDRNLWDLSQVRDLPPERVSDTTRSTSWPWKQVGVDLFELNKKEYLITVDYSNFCEVDRLTSTTSSAVVLKLKNHFARYGCPNHLISDYGLSSCHQGKFTNDWDFEHRTSSPGNSNANGKVESAALGAGTGPYIAILDYRNTATQGIESSPAQCLMNRRTRTLLPTTKTLLQPRAHRASGISNNWISDKFNSLATTISMLMTYPRSKVMSYVWSHSSWEIKSGKKGTIT